MKYLSNNFFSKFTLSMLLVGVMFSLITALALAQGGARLFLQPVETGPNTVTVEITAENVTDLYGAEFYLKYDPAALAVIDAKPDQEGTQIQPGSLLSANLGFVVANQVKEGEGLVTFAMTLLNPAPPVTGSGPLARLTFKRLAQTPSTVTFDRAKLVAVNLQTIPVELTPFTVSDQVQVQASLAAPAAPGSGSFPWWILAVAIMVGGLLALGALMLLTRPKANTPPPPSASLRTRPIAFKD